MTKELCRKSGKVLIVVGILASLICSFSEGRYGDYEWNMLIFIAILFGSCIPAIFLMAMADILENQEKIINKLDKRE